MNEFKDNAKNTGRNLGNKAKNGIKNGAKNLGNKAKDAAKDSFDNSTLGQGIQKGKDAYNTGKKVIKGAKKAGTLAIKGAKKAAVIAKALFNPITLAILLVLIILFVVIVMISYYPGIGGDVKEEENYSNFSEVDRKTLDKMKELFNDYPNADGALAMATVIYPYYGTLHDGNVFSILSSSKNKGEKEEVPDVSEEIDLKDPLLDVEDVKDTNDPTEDDPYLIIFRQSKIRKKLKAVLKELNKSSKEDFDKYLKDDYFKKDKGYGDFKEDGLDGYNGYKEMFDSIEKEDREKLAYAIIEDLKDKKEWFIDYVYESKFCSTGSTSLGHSDAGNIIKGTPVVVLKDSISGKFEDIKNAPTLYGTDDLSLSLKRYVLGVSYAEIGTGVKNEALAKAEMITAQSFLLGRTHSGSGLNVGKGFKPDYTDNNTIFYMRGNTYDQDFCDIYEGCASGSRYAKDLIQSDPTGEAHTNVKGKLDDASIQQLEVWYEDVKNQFIYDDASSQFYAMQFNQYNKNCNRGSCFSQKDANKLATSGSDYNDILFGPSGAFTQDRFVLFDLNEQNLTKVSVDCVEITSEGSCNVPNDKFIYYSQKVGEFSGKPFCGSSNTIKRAGCGITSMAMILSNLSNTKVTPDTTNAEAQALGYCGPGISGTAAGYFKVAADKYGLTHSMGVKKENMDIDKATEDINTTLRSGGLVIVNVNSNWLNGNSGHYIVLKGIDGDGNAIVADPYADNILGNKNRNYMPAKKIIKDFVNIDSGWYMFTGPKSSEIVTNYCSTVKVDSSGETTGTLTDPITPTNTNAQTLVSLKDNSRTLYYLNGKYHGGTDFPVAIGTPVHAMDGGIVTRANKDIEYGYNVVIEHEIGGKKFWSIYAHLSSNDKVRKGDKVSQGQVIGLSGNSGNSSGPHLHVTLTTLRGIYGRAGKGHQYLVLDYIGTGKKYYEDKPMYAK